MHRQSKQMSTTVAAVVADDYGAKGKRPKAEYTSDVLGEPLPYACLSICPIQK